MHRSWKIWAAYVLGVALVLGALAFVSHMLVTLEKQTEEMRAREGVEERIRLALWRMESVAAPLVGRESGHPYFWFSSFYPAGRAYTRMFAPVESGDILFPSPLLTTRYPEVRIHFQLSPDGHLSSPQVPEGNLLELAQSVYELKKEVVEARRRLNQLQPVLKPALKKLFVPGLDGQSEEESAPDLVDSFLNQSGLMVTLRKLVGSYDWRIRSLASQHVARWRNIASSGIIDPEDVVQESVRPFWSGDRLLLARQVLIGPRRYIQGSELDWPAVREALLSTVRDLLPDSSLEQIVDESDLDHPRALASLPVRFKPGKPELVQVPEGMTPIRLALLLGWLSVLIGAVAVGIVLRTVLALGERRAAFVSAVTHELRTPLTSLQMYTEMLDDGIITEPEQIRSYVGVLRQQAVRLGHLVENVLAYARIEKAGIHMTAEELSFEALLERVVPRLLERTQKAELSLNTYLPDEIRSRTLKLDVAATERILFNLVDNACKYAATSNPPEIHIYLSIEKKKAVLKVVDFGPGIDRKRKGLLFREFSKSASDAAHSAPGVGLGLAISRRLAIRMGGNLKLDRRVEKGCCFVLELPIPRNQQEDRG